jgi:hypothetical protein
MKTSGQKDPERNEIMDEDGGRDNRERAEAVERDLFDLFIVFFEPSKISSVIQKVFCRSKSGIEFSQKIKK